MGETTVKCTKCGHKFKPGKLKDIGAGSGLGAMGYVAGGKAGLAAFGTAIVAAAPAAIAAGAIGVAASSQLTRCPECKKIQTK
jgi:hypothetical protein